MASHADAIALPRGARISPHSFVRDPMWQLDIRRAGERMATSRVKWPESLPPNSRVAPAQFSALVRAAKHFVWSMTTEPQSGRRPWSHSAIAQRADQLAVLIRWMATEGISSFTAFDQGAVRRFREWIALRPGRRPGVQISAKTAGHYLQLLKALHRQRFRLPDALLLDPCSQETASAARGSTEATSYRIPAIPDAVAVHLLSSALAWIEARAEEILRARAIRRALEMERNPSYATKKVLSAARLASCDGLNLTNIGEVRGAENSLMDACFIVIGGFVGMRVSEILSLQVGAVQTDGNGQAYVVGRLFKTSGRPEGRIERWLAPPPVVRAVEVLEALAAPLRPRTVRTELFVKERSGDGRIGLIERPEMIKRMNAFSARVGTPLHEDKPWRLTTHQLRKTFARFIAKRDRSQLHALAAHFKHASIAMTSKGYVGTDYDLHELVEEEGRNETAAVLEKLLTTDGLAGRLGERINARGALFRGRAGTQLRRDYIGFVMKETDLRIHACEYGWCVFQQETARCGGALGPNEAERSPTVCLSCANMVVEAQHEPYWLDRRARNAVLLPASSLLTRAVLEEAIDQCDRVLAKIGVAVADQKNNEAVRRPSERNGQSVPSRSGTPAPRRRKSSEACGKTGAHLAGSGGARSATKP